MLELAERCEKATGPDCELDKAIAEAFGWRFRRPGVKGMEIAFSRDGVARKTPRPTASIDAALTLVPEGCCVDMRRFDGGSEGFVQIRSTDATPDDADDELYVETEHCATLPLALCAAALRARAADTPSVKP